MKHRTSRLVNLLAIAALGAVSPGCASSTKITSDPSGAEVYIDGEKVGETPYEYREKSVWVWTQHDVAVRQKGYIPAEGQLETHAVPGFVALGIIGCICLFPALLTVVGRYEDTYHFDLQDPGDPSDRTGEGGGWVQRVPLGPGPTAAERTSLREGATVDFSE
jgi:hypothetical protein